jgi:ribosome-associated translation inhibitor RaiA
MQRPVEIVFRGLERSEAMEERIRERTDALLKRFPRLQNLRVTVESSHKHQNKGRRYEVCLDARVPGEELVVSDIQEDAYAAIKEAFQIAMRKLDDWKEKNRVPVPPPDSISM